MRAFGRWLAVTALAVLVGAFLGWLFAVVTPDPAGANPANTLFHADTHPGRDRCPMARRMEGRCLKRDDSGTGAGDPHAWLRDEHQDRQLSAYVRDAERAQRDLIQHDDDEQRWPHRRQRKQNCDVYAAAYHGRHGESVPDPLRRYHGCDRFERDFIYHLTEGLRALARLEPDPS